MDGIQGQKGDQGLTGEIGEMGPIIKGEKGLCLPFAFAFYSSSSESRVVILVHDHVACDFTQAPDSGVAHRQVKFVF